MIGNTGEPFGWPRGTVRALLTIALTAFTGFMFIAGMGVPSEWMAINGVVVAYYFGYRTQAPVPPEPLAPPALTPDGTN